MASSQRTGSGKTISFTVPVLVDAVLDTLHVRPFSGARWTQLLIYPRNDSAFDQFATSRIIVLASISSCPRRSVWEHQLVSSSMRMVHISNECESIPAPAYHPQGQWDQQWNNPRKPNVVAASASRYGSQSTPAKQAHRPANIIIASSESFRRRLMIPEVCTAVRESSHRVVLDEIHLAEGTNGGHLRGLFNRIKQMARPRKLQFIGASATIASPEQHAEAVWGEEAQPAISPRLRTRIQWSTGWYRNHALVRPCQGHQGWSSLQLNQFVGHQSKNAEWFEARNAGELTPPISTR